MLLFVVVLLLRSSLGGRRGTVGGQTLAIRIAILRSEIFKIGPKKIKRNYCLFYNTEGLSAQLRNHCR